MRVRSDGLMKRHPKNPIIKPADFPNGEATCQLSELIQMCLDEA